MKVITFAASKGGAGKTTLMHNVATYAAGLGRGVLIADLDPQKSLAKLWDLRGELVNPRLVTNITKVAQSVAMLKSAGYDKEFLLVDTPGSLIPIMRDAIEAADVVVLPTRPNPVDLKAQADVIDLVENAGKITKALFVLTQAEKGDITNKAAEFLQPLSKHPVLLMPKRVEYPRAQDKGRAGWENNNDAKADIRKIWEAIAALAYPHRDRKEEEQRVVH